MARGSGTGRNAEGYATGTDLTGYRVEAADGRIGKVDKHSEDVGDAYLLVDTGPWIFGRVVLVPAGTVTRIDHDDRSGLAEPDDGRDQELTRLRPGRTGRRPRPPPQRRRLLPRHRLIPPSRGWGWGRVPGVPEQPGQPGATRPPDGPTAVGRPGSPPRPGPPADHEAHARPRGRSRRESGAPDTVRSPGCQEPGRLFSLPPSRLRSAVQVNAADVRRKAAAVAETSRASWWRRPEGSPGPGGGAARWPVRFPSGVRGTRRDSRRRPGPCSAEQRDQDEREKGRVEEGGERQAADERGGDGRPDRGRAQDRPSSGQERRQDGP